MFNIVEMMADEQREAPCAHGNIVVGHACYCHADTPHTPRKCHIWRHHAEELKFWRKSRELDPDKGCPYYRKNPKYSPQPSPNAASSQP
jgi:hypothetical protein